MTLVLAMMKTMIHVLTMVITGLENNTEVAFGVLDGDAGDPAAAHDDDDGCDDDAMI